MVSWADAESCRRCGRLFAHSAGAAAHWRGARDFSAPRLGTFQGIGTRLIGWTHLEDGTATATVWFTFLFLPIFPLSRYQLLSPGQEDFAPKPSPGRGLQGLGLPGMTTYYSFTGRLPLSGAEVVNTYLYAYVWMPVKLLAPVAALVLFEQLSPSGPDGSSETRLVVFGVVLSAWFGYVLYVLSNLLHRSRGGTA
jgi:hypothetical protein